MQKWGYKILAGFYDYFRKDHVRESIFLCELLETEGIETVLDVGCGTGLHMAYLEDEGFYCEGLDLHEEMLEIAMTRVRGELYQANMIDFSLGRYDAIICMYAVFNHLMPEDAKKAVECFKRHADLVVIDLHNPQKSGTKTEIKGHLTRTMTWDYDPKTRIEKTKVLFKLGKQRFEDEHKLRIYSIDEMREMIGDLRAYEDHTFKEATYRSKNIQVVARFK